MKNLILGAMNALIFLLFENDFMYWNRSIVGDKFYLERIFPRISLRTLL